MNKKKGVLYVTVCNINDYILISLRHRRNTDVRTKLNCVTLVRTLVYIYVQSDIGLKATSFDATTKIAQSEIAHQPKITSV